MITEKTLNKWCQEKGLDLHQNLTIGTRKVYCVTQVGDTKKKVLSAGYMGYLSNFVKTYKATNPELNALPVSGKQT